MLELRHVFKLDLLEQISDAVVELPVLKTQLLSYDHSVVEGTAGAGH